MDEEMEDTFDVRFLDVEIDLDYEFDACRYFDFSRTETPSEAQEVELWFESAGSYPPSPFIAKLNLTENILVDNINTSPKPKDVENTNVHTNDSDIGIAPGISALDENNREHEGMSRIFINLLTGNLQNVCNEEKALTTGLTFYNHMAKDISKVKTKSTIKASFPRASTLMKPTASQLAKQNRPREVCNSSQFFGRSRKPFVQNSGRSLENPSVVESQAAKRQKLEGGHLRKVAETKQQTILIHKAPKKDGTVDGNVAHARLKLTIPREPDLETAHRAQRTRPKKKTGLIESANSTAQIFKARPLNRKILEAPSLRLPQKSTPRLPEFQEFHLKTSERAMQHPSSVSLPLLHGNKSDKVVHKAKTSSITHNAITDSKRLNSVDASNLEECEIAHKFKARPLNKKIFSSKGDIGVFRNRKREATVPMEFNFSTDKRFQHNPPIELFNKLSLTSELQQNNTVSQPKLPWPSFIPNKGSKENTVGAFQQEHGMAHVIKEKPQRFGGTQIQHWTDGGISEIRPRANMGRSLGLR